MSQKPDKKRPAPLDKRRRFFYNEINQTKGGITMKPIPGTLTVLAPLDAEIFFNPTPDPKAKKWFPGTRRESRGKAIYTFKDFPVGICHAVLKGAKYYPTDVPVFWTEEAKKTGLVAEPPVIECNGKGWEQMQNPVRFLLQPGALDQIAPDDPALWKDYAEVFQTPSFDPSLGPHEVAHQGAVTAFIRREIASCPNAYLFTLGKSGKWKYDLNMVLFTETDLRGVKTVEEAAERLKDDGKVKLHYQAQIHGNEPAACDGALAQIHALCGEKGKKLLSRMDIYVFPRVNPDGARAFIRNEVAKGVNLNRDMFTVRCPEVQVLHRAVRAFRPEVVFDAHEYTFKNEIASGSYSDILMSIGGGVNNGPEPRRVSEEMMLRGFEALAKNGLRGFAYNNVDTPKKGYTTNSINPTTGRLYRSLGGALSFLVETRGAHIGKGRYHRRVVAQYITVSSLLESVYERADEIRAVIAAERKDLAARGAKPDPKRPFILKAETSHTPESCVWVPFPTFDYITGECTDPDHKAEVYRIDTALRTRPFPKAYLVPRGRKWEKEVRERLELLGLEYELLPAGAEVTARQYRAGADPLSAELAKKARVAFPRGAVRVPTAQSGILYAAYLFEPDIGDAREGATSFVQTGVIPAAKDGAYPLYRQD